MLTLDTIITTSILITLIAFSPMAISLMHDNEPRIAPIAYAANK